MSKTATQQGPSGLFATARRGGLTGPEIVLVNQLRSGDRPVSWQNIARRLGRCELDLRAMCEPIDTPSPPLVKEAKVIPFLAQATTGRRPFPFTEAHVAVIQRCARREISQRKASEEIGCSLTAIQNALLRLVA